MTKTQYDVIVAIIRNGAPVLAEELIKSINGLIKDNTEMKAKLDKPEEKTEE